MFPTPPANVPPDPVEPIPPPPPSHMKVLSAAGLAAMLAAMSMLGPFSIDAYLPAFPNIQATLGATPLEVQQSLTFYMLAFAAMVLWHGALSDAFGRRPTRPASRGTPTGSAPCARRRSPGCQWRTSPATPAPHCGARRRPPGRRATTPSRRRPACRTSGFAALRAGWRSARPGCWGRPADRRRSRMAPASTSPPAWSPGPPR